MEIIQVILSILQVILLTILVTTFNKNSVSKPKKTVTKPLQASMVKKSTAPIVSELSELQPKTKQQFEKEQRNEKEADIPDIEDFF